MSRGKVMEYSVVDVPSGLLFCANQKTGLMERWLLLLPSVRGALNILADADSYETNQPRCERLNSSL